MDDTALRREKYRCEFNGADGITICDLFIKAANPLYSRQVKLKKGEYILTELLDFEDLKKSRLKGALSKFIEMGWIVVENAAEVVEKTERKVIEMRVPTPSNAITEVQAGTVKPSAITNLVATAAQPVDLGYPKESHPEVIESIPLDKSRNVNSFAIEETSISQSVEREFEKFNSLRYFQKLKTIKETTNIQLLELISTKSNYPQLVHNSKNRIREIRTGK